jgi:ABC-2 type transport system permease protein
MRILDLAIKDLRQLARDRKTFLFLLILPVFLTVLFGFAFGGEDTADPRLRVGFTDEDQSALSAELAALLEESAVIRLEKERGDAEALADEVANEDLPAALVIPAGFDAALRAGEPIPLRLVAISGQQAGFTIESEIQSAISRLASAVNTAHTSTGIAAAHGLLATETAREASFETALAAALAAWADRPVTMRTTMTGRAEAEAEEEVEYFSAYANSSPGMMAQFALAGLAGAAGILVVEKKNGSLRRLLTTNLSRTEILFGHFLAMFALIFMQVMVLVIFGQLVLKLNYFSAPLAVLLMAAATALFCAAFGLLIGCIANKDEHVMALALVPMFLLSALGGAWLPLEFTPETFQRIAYLTPVAWIMEGFQDIIVRGLGVRAVLTAVAILLLYTIALFAIAAWRFSRTDVTS